MEKNCLKHFSVQFNLYKEKVEKYIQLMHLRALFPFLLLVLLCTLNGKLVMKMQDVQKENGLIHAANRQF
jgi:hypothetical protein